MGRTSRKRHQKKKLNVRELNAKDIAQNEEEILMHLKDWLLANNCLVVYDLVPFNFPVTGRGLKTLKDIKSKDVLIQIPYKILITTSTLSESPINTLFSKNKCYSAQCILSVFLIYEQHLGNASKWYHYIRSLPQTLANPDFCTSKEKRLLPTFIMDYMQEFHKVQNDFCLLVESMNIVNEQINCPHCSEHIKTIITFERYKWAYYIVNTRAIYMDTSQMERNSGFTSNIKHPNNLALAPFLDLFNHDIHTAVQVSVTTNKNDDKFYEIISLKAFDKGSQAFINYGSHNSLKLYVDYGFFIPNNPLDEVYFDIVNIQTCFNIPKSKLDFIVQNNLHKNMAFVRQGLNYNALYALFIVSTKLQRQCWSTKIYGDALTPEDTENIYNIAKKIWNLKKDELVNHIRNMKGFKHCSESFSIAINLIEEYIIILNESHKNFCMLH